MSVLSTFHDRCYCFSSGTKGGKLEGITKLQIQYSLQNVLNRDLNNPCDPAALRSVPD